MKYLFDDYLAMRNPRLNGIVRFVKYNVLTSVCEKAIDLHTRLRSNRFGVTPNTPCETEPSTTTGNHTVLFDNVVI
jgi:hypothetical protein